MQFILGFFAGILLGLVVFSLCRFLTCARPDPDRFHLARLTTKFPDIVVGA